jgi:HlyD family secretion protein
MTNAVDDYDDFLDGGNHRWRRRAVGLALVVALAVAGVFVLWAMVLRDGGSAASAVQTAKVQRGSIMKTISTSATTASQSTANLSFSQSGKVTAVNVTVGQAVKQGDVLAEVDATTLQDALTRAQVNLASAQRSVNKLLESPTAADTASADQSVIQAQANLDKANTALQDLYNPTSDAQNSAQQAVLSAQSQLTKAQQARANLDTTWSDSHTAAEAAVEKAQKTLDSAERAVNDASDNLSLAQAKLEGAETAYHACDPSFFGSTDVPISASDEDALLSVIAGGTSTCTAADASSVLSANTAYKTARVTKSNAEDAVDLAEQDLQTANDKLDELGSGPTSDDIASADAAVQSAQLALTSANDKLAALGQPSTDDVTQAQHDVDSAAAALTAAEAKRDEIYQGSKPEDISAAQDQVRLAQISADEAKNDLEKAQIIAPFDGTVSALNINVGDTAGTSTSSSSSSTAAIVLNTPNALILNLSVGESDLPNVKAGESGTAIFDALTGQVFPIIIDSVGTTATTTQGVVTYQARAHIVSGQAAGQSTGGFTGRSRNPSAGQTPQAQGTPDATQNAAPNATPNATATAAATPVPGMNATVTIIVDQVQDVLYVPASAIQTEGQSSVVTIQNDDGSTTRQTVETGLTNGTNTEITNGLEEGQTVIIPSVSASTSSSTTNSSQGTNGFFGGSSGGDVIPGGFPRGD